MASFQKFLDLTSVSTTAFANTVEFAQQQDAEDALAPYREQFHFPVINGKRTLYFTGNSLGLQPKSAQQHVQQELDDWARWGVEGHFHAKHPWFAYHEFLTASLAKLVGAKVTEVVAMNGLTTNLHLLMVSFYRPAGKRIKILCEEKAFPSDQYALESQARFHGFDPDEVIVEVGPRAGEHLIHHEDIVSKIKELGDELALVMLGGVNYYSGQVFNMKSITQAAHAVGAIAGFDLAHAAGNLKLNLHDWEVDFAAWCSYKYLNSSPGGVSGVYIHEKHATNDSLPRFAGWWGHDKDERFKMEKGFRPIPTAESWQLSNAPVMTMAVHKAALEMFDAVGMNALCTKRDRLTGFLEFIIDDISARIEQVDFEIITPRNPINRGCQLSILVHGQGKALFDKLTDEGVIADWRNPNVIRMAPVPLYNSFEDVWQFGQILEKALVSD